MKHIPIIPKGCIIKIRFARNMKWIPILLGKIDLQRGTQRNIFKRVFNALQIMYRITSITFFPYVFYYWHVI